MNIINLLTEMFKRDGIGYMVNEDETRLVVPGKSASVEMTVEIYHLDKRFEIQSLLPVRVPLARRKEVAEFISYANWKLGIGAFIMNFLDGELRYKVNGFIDQDKFEETGFEEFFTEVVHMALTAIEDFHEIFLKVITHAISAVQGIEILELKIKQSEETTKVPGNLLQIETIIPN